MSRATHRQIESCRGRSGWLGPAFVILAVWMSTCLATRALAWQERWTTPTHYDTSNDTHVPPIVWTLPILFLLFIYRRPSGAKPNRLNSPATSNGGGDIASLSCSRCGRVLELPRDKAARQLFCPRCGSTLPRLR